MAELGPITLVFHLQGHKHMIFFTVGLEYVSEIMTIGNVFTRRGAITTNSNNGRGLLIFFIHGSDLTKPEGIIQDLNLAQYFSNFKNSCFSRLRLCRFEELFEFFPPPQ